MKIGDVIRNYRKANKLSLREFAQKCGTSHSYIAMLEANKNSKNGEPITPSLAMLDKIATSVGMGLRELLDICDDMPVSLGGCKTENPLVLSEDERMFVEILRQIPEEERELYYALLKKRIETP